MRAEQDATVAKIEATWPVGRTHNIGEVPALPATPYNDVAVMPGSPQNYRVGSRHSMKLYRAVVRSFGRDVAEVMFAAQKVEDALLDERISPDYSPCRSEVATPVTDDPDGEGLLMIARTFTFSRTF